MDHFVLFLQQIQPQQCVLKIKMSAFRHRTLNPDVVHNSLLSYILKIE